MKGKEKKGENFFPPLGVFGLNFFLMGEKIWGGGATKPKARGSIRLDLTHLQASPSGCWVTDTTVGGTFVPPWPQDRGPKAKSLCLQVMKGLGHHLHLGEAELPDLLIYT